MESLVQKRRKILSLFLLGVGLPSIGLGYLAVRGVRNEMALLEQQGLAEYRILSQRTTDTLLAAVRAAEEEVVRTYTGGGHAPVEFRQTHPLVEEVFLLDSLGAIHLPWARLLYLSDGALSSSPRPWPAVAAAHMRSGRNFEFVRREPFRALAAYQQAFDAANEPTHRGEALLAVARVQRKSGQAAAALASCEKLDAEYSHVRTTTGLLLGPVARLEEGSLLLARGDTEDALRTLVELYNSLVEGEWRLTRGEYGFLVAQVRDSTSSALSRSAPGPRTDSLGSVLKQVESTEADQAARTERLLRFKADAAEPLASRISALRPGSPVPGAHLDVESAGESFLISVPTQIVGSRGTLGLLLDIRALTGVLEGTLGRIADPATTDWVLKGRDGHALLGGESPPEGPATLTATFPENFPPWLLELHQRPMSPVRILFASSRSVYSYMLLLIATILVFGLVLTARTVTQELELARLKSDFLSSVSHEFRSPLTSIRHLAEILQADAVPSEERRRRYYDVLVEQSTRLSTLVTNILDLARIEEGRQEFHFEAVDPAELIEDVVETTRHRVQHDGFTVEVDIRRPMPKLRADRVTMAQALFNLLDNAARYSGESRTISVHASADATLVTVAVVDRGIGIPAGEIGKVFDRFYRGGDPLTRSVKGSGLGLALVKEIVEAHGGTVHVESEVGEGSTFAIRLPVMTE